MTDSFRQVIYKQYEPRKPEVRDADAGMGEEQFAQEIFETMAEERDNRPFHDKDLINYGDINDALKKFSGRARELKLDPAKARSIMHGVLGLFED